MPSNHTDYVTINLRWCEPEKARDLQLPNYKTDGSAGMDVAAAIDKDVVIRPGKIELIPTGFGIEIPDGFEVQVRPRSGLAIRHGVTIVNAPGTIDSDYRGEVKIGLINLGSLDFIIHRGDRIAQLVVSPIARAQLVCVEVLNETERGEGGFGHTGIKR